MEQRPKKRLSWLGVLILVAALCAAAFLIARWVVLRHAPGIREAIPIPAPANAEAIEVMPHGLIYYDGMTLHAMNSRGRQLWSYSAGSRADFAVDANGVSVWNDTKISLLTDQGATIHSANMDKPVLSAHMGERYAAIQVGAEHNSELVIIEREGSGRSIDSIGFANLTVLDYGFFSNGNLLWVLTLNTEGTTPLCMISTYQPGRMLAGTISESDQILYRVIFRTAQIHAVGTKYIRAYDYKAKEQPGGRRLVYGWYAVSVDPGSDNPLMAFAPTNETSAIPKISDVRLIKGDAEQTVRFNEACSSVYVNKETLYGFSNMYVFIARMNDKKPTAHSLPIYADSVFGVTGDGSAIISSGGSVYLVPLSV